MHSDRCPTKSQAGVGGINPLARFLPVDLFERLGISKPIYPLKNPDGPNGDVRYHSLAFSKIAHVLYDLDPSFKVLVDNTALLLSGKKSPAVRDRQYSKGVDLINLVIWKKWFDRFIEAPLTTQPPPCFETSFTDKLASMLGIDTRFVGIYQHQVRTAQGYVPRMESDKPIKFHVKMEPFFDANTGFVGVQLSHPWELKNEKLRGATVVRIALGVSVTHKELPSDLVVSLPKTPMDDPGILFQSMSFASRRLKNSQIHDTPDVLMGLSRGPGELSFLIYGFQACIRRAVLRDLMPYNEKHGNARAFYIVPVSEAILTGRNVGAVDKYGLRHSLNNDRMGIPFHYAQANSLTDGEHHVLIGLSRPLNQALLREGNALGYRFNIYYQFFNEPTHGSYAQQAWRLGGMPPKLPQSKHVGWFSISQIPRKPGQYLLVPGYVDRNSGRYAISVLNKNLMRWLYGENKEFVHLRSQCTLNGVKRHRGNGRVNYYSRTHIAGRMVLYNGVAVSGEFLIVPVEWKKDIQHAPAPGPGVLFLVDKNNSNRSNNMLVMVRRPIGAIPTRKVLVAKGERSPQCPSNDLEILPFNTYAKFLDLEGAQLLGCNAGL